MNQQNESPFGNPRFLAALGITFLGLWGWQFYVSSKYPQVSQPVIVEGQANKQAGQQVTDSTAQPVEKTVEKAFGDVSATSQVSAPEAQAEKLLAYDDSKVSFSVSSKGMGIKDFTLKNYTNRKNEKINFSSTVQAPLTVQNKTVDFDIKAVSDSEFVGVADVAGQKITRTLKYNKDTGSFTSDLNFSEGLDSVQYLFSQNQLHPESTNFLMPSFEHQDFIFIAGGSTNNEKISSLKPGEGFIKTIPSVDLIAVGTQYFAAATINKSELIPSANLKVENNIATIQVNYDLKNKNINQLSQVIYMGAKKASMLNAIDPRLSEIHTNGMFAFISKILMKLMVWLHGYLNNWGLAIIALTIIVRTILLPFNIMSFRSAQAMQKAKPKLDAIRERYKDDPMRMNKETMAAMKENNANPLSGCLPMLLQIPIFFALWTAIGSSIEIYQQPFFGWITDLSHYDPFFVFPVLMGITMYFQQKLTPTTMDPLQAKILNFMPIIFTLFMLTLPSGLTLYNFVSALFGVIQQYFLLKETKKQSA